MPRIRTIKPQFWDDEDVARLSSWARLLFIGSWNFADDDSIILWNPEYIRSKIYPYDDFSLEDVEGFMNELIKLKFARKYKTRSGKAYAVIVKMLHHQVINRPQSSHKPHPRWWSEHCEKIRILNIKSSLNTPGEFTDDSSQGKEGKGIRKGKDKNPPIVPPKGGRRLRYILENRITGEKINVRADNNVDARNQTPWPMDETIVYQRPK